MLSNSRTTHMKAAAPVYARTFLLGICLLFAFSAGRLYAQTDTTDSDEALPDIAPQEVEIRGTLDISFPSLERQPLVGFNPPPSTYEVPDDRRPYIEEYKQRAADLPNSSLQEPEAPEAAGRFERLNRGMLKAGAGRLLQRTLYGTLNYAVKPQLELDTEVDYSGSQGFMPEESWGFSSAYDTFEGRLGLTAHRSSFQLYGALDGFYNSYVLYGAAGPTDVPNDSESAGTTFPQPNRYGAGASITAGIESQGILPSRLELTYGASRYETNFEGEDTTGTFGVERGNHAAVDADLNKGFGSFTLSLDGEGAIGGTDGNSVFEGDYMSYDAGLQGRWDNGGPVDIRLGARLLGYQASAQNGSGKLAYISPAGKLTFRASNELHLYVQNTPSTTISGLSGLYDTNPYLSSNLRIKPTVATIDAEGGARIYRGTMQFGVWGGVREYPIYRFFHASGWSGPAPARYTRGFFRVGYEEARIIHGGGRASVQLPQGVEAALDLKLRQARLTDDSTVIPYVAPVSSSLSLAYPFAGDRGRLQVDGTIYSSRYVDLANNERVGAYVDFDAEASYDIVDAFGIYARLDNMSVGALEEWNRYPHPPFVAQGGIRVFW